MRKERIFLFVGWKVQPDDLRRSRDTGNGKHEHKALSDDRGDPSLV